MPPWEAWLNCRRLCLALGLVLQERAHYASELEALIEQTEGMMAERAQVRGWGSWE